MKLKVKRIHPEAKLPTKAYETDTGWDLYANEDVTLRPGVTILVSTGVAFEFPEGWWGKIFDRSSMAKKRTITSGGVLDNSYRGEAVVMITYNDQSENYGDFIIKKGDKIAQMALLPVPKVELEEVEELSQTDRGSKGFGSSNAK